jgi:hypothetical protein
MAISSWLVTVRVKRFNVVIVNVFCQDFVLVFVALVYVEFVNSLSCFIRDKRILRLYVLSWRRDFIIIENSKRVLFLDWRKGNKIFLPLISLSVLFVFISSTQVRETNEKVLSSDFSSALPSFIRVVGFSSFLQCTKSLKSSPGDKEVKEWKKTTKWKWVE